MCRMTDAVLARYGNDPHVSSETIRAFCDGWNACADAMGEQYHSERLQNTALRRIFNCVAALTSQDGVQKPDTGNILPFPTLGEQGPLSPEVLAAAMQSVLYARGCADRLEAMLHGTQAAYNLGSTPPEGM